MNDDFLYNIRPPVKKAFSDRLYQRLQLVTNNPKQRNGFHFMKQWILHFQAWKFVLLIMLFLIAFVFAVSEPVRARTLEWIKNVAGFTVDEQNQPNQLPVNEEGQVLAYAVPTSSLPEALKTHH